MTHVATGYAIEQELTEKAAIKLAQELRRAPLSDQFWTAFRTVKAFREQLGDPLVKLVDERRKRARLGTQQAEAR